MWWRSNYTSGRGQDRFKSTVELKITRLWWNTHRTVKGSIRRSNKGVNSNMPTNLDKRIWPKQWKESVYVPIPKKGDARICSNNRTIGLISHASKVMLKVVQHSLDMYMEQEMAIEQAGFTKGRGTRDQISNLRWIMETHHYGILWKKWVYHGTWYK